jgi:hypothetical protein
MAVNLRETDFCHDMHDKDPVRGISSPPLARCIAASGGLGIVLAA